MQFTEEDLNNLSELARITIKEDEKGKMLSDMKAILGYVSEINEGVASNHQTTVNINARERRTQFNVVREDEIKRETGKNTEILLEEAPETEKGFVKVPQVIK